MPLSCLYSSTPQFGLTSSHGCLPGTLPLPRPCCLDGPACDCGCCNITPPATFTPLGLCLLALGLCLVSKELLTWSPHFSQASLRWAGQSVSHAGLPCGQPCIHLSQWSLLADGVFSDTLLLSLCNLSPKAEHFSFLLARGPKLTRASLLLCTLPSPPF